jgi:hypothetical protein
MDDRSNYREGDLIARLAETERTKEEALDRIRTLERRLASARKRARAKQVMGAVSVASLGSLVGTVAGAVAWAFLDSPFFMVAGATLGFVLVFLVATTWSPPEDDGFPPPPPPRIHTLHF